MKTIAITLSVILVCVLISMKNPDKGVQLPKSVRNEYAFIPMSTTSVDGELVSVMAFFMSKTEISNMQYKEFLSDLKSKGMEKEFQIASIDSTGWDIPYSYCEPLRVHYHVHPAYDGYPVVNISHEGARLYCKWLEEKLKSENPMMNFSVRLPQRAELISAGRCSEPNRPYAWPGTSLNDIQGKQNCNYWMIRQERIHRNPGTGQVELLSQESANTGTYFFTSHCTSFAPNEWGLYNLCGNVAEMTDIDGIAVGGSWYSTGYDVRLSSIDTISGPNPRTGFRPVISFLEVKK